MGYVVTESGLSGVGVLPMFRTTLDRLRAEIAARAAAAKAATVKTTVVPSVTTTKPVVTTKPAVVTNYYWFNAQTGLTSVRTNAIAPTGTGWVRYPTAVALAEAKAAWTRAKIVAEGKPQIYVRPPTETKPVIVTKPVVTKPLVYVKPPTEIMPTLYWWAHRVTGTVRQQAVRPDASGNWQQFTSQAAAQTWLQSLRKPVPVLPPLPPKEKPTVVTLPTGETVTAKPVVTTGGEVVSVPAGTTVPVVTASGDVRAMDAMAVAAAKPVDEGDGKIFGLPSTVVWIGGAAVLLLIILPMLTKKGRR